jgi:hypothetical protein
VEDAPPAVACVEPVTHVRRLERVVNGQMDSNASGGGSENSTNPSTRAQTPPASHVTQELTDAHGWGSSPAPRGRAFRCNT